MNFVGADLVHCQIEMQVEIVNEGEISRHQTVVMQARIWGGNQSIITMFIFYLSSETSKQLPKKMNT